MKIKHVIYLFIFFGTIIFFFAVLSQPVAIVTQTLSNAYPNNTTDFPSGGTVTGLEIFIEAALGVAVVIGVLVLFFFFGFFSLGGKKRDF